MAKFKDAPMRWAYCNDCDKVLLFYGNYVLSGYLHACPECKKEEYLDKRYPNIIEEEVK